MSYVTCMWKDRKYYYDIRLVQSHTQHLTTPKALGTPYLQREFSRLRKFQLFEKILFCALLSHKWVHDQFDSGKSSFRGGPFNSTTPFLISLSENTIFQSICSLYPCLCLMFMDLYGSSPNSIPLGHSPGSCLKGITLTQPPSGKFSLTVTVRYPFHLCVFSTTLWTPTDKGLVHLCWYHEHNV